MGEPAGIGGEISLKAWRVRKQKNLPVFFVIDDPSRLSEMAFTLGWTIPLIEINDPKEAVAAYEHGLPVMPLSLGMRVAPGRPDPDAVKVVMQSIRLGVDLCMSGKASAMVTNPIHKNVMHQGGFTFPGHTEYLASLLHLEHQEIMMLACPTLRVVPVTIHVSLTQAIASLTQDRIIEICLNTERALKRDFGIEHPRLAVAGLNPHAGEEGDMGREEIDIVSPAIHHLKTLGLNVQGPLPPDTMFHERARSAYDVAICMYHDQALIPLKTLGFDSGVNVTLGLPIVRTSPDHGTAFDIAGTGQANENSFINALCMAAEIAKSRAR